jgi:hypothetical protein
MDYEYINSFEVVRLITSFKQDLASAGASLKPVCFCESAATAAVGEATVQCLSVSAAGLRVKHTVLHGEINGVEIMSPGDKE